MLSSPLQERIKSLILPSLEDMGYALVQARLLEHKGGRKLQVMAEHTSGAPMTVDDCADISRTLSAILDVDDPIDGAYDLEVSSPGIDRPLVSVEDFERYAGSEAKIETALPIEGRRRFKGKIAGIKDGVITIAGDEEYKIDFDNINHAKLVLTDELIRGYLQEQKRKAKKG